MIYTLILIIIGAILTVLLRWFFSPYFNYRNRNKGKGIRMFENGDLLKQIPTPLLLDDQFKELDVDLTIVVPAYNEDQRLPTMMTETIDYLTKKIKEGLFKKVEIIIVDDGSRDKTLEQIRGYTEVYNTGRTIVVRGVQLVIN
jgi:dolichyl-phosphate beta-glucosyltransferase